MTNTMTIKATNGYNVKVSTQKNDTYFNTTDDYREGVRIISIESLTVVCTNFNSIGDDMALAFGTVKHENTEYKFCGVLHKNYDSKVYELSTSTTYEGTIIRIL